MSQDTTIKKVQSEHSPMGDMGQKYLVAGKRLSMRLWENVPRGEADPPHRRDYETVGYALAGRARLELEGQEIVLRPGDCWLVPAGAAHRYRVEEDFTAIEATSPPAEFHEDGDIR
ncbi:cupin domain-containing protein [Roseibacterium sp. SDUM158017]|uniref:cupin domain-containing protein n=1 Tax=Roseicyclus salinarum TaxID=3036773 RepID=UPI002415292C|nr:cupin domain-containing protein [Roseibacterium sp. SDUM158017]MDG4649599.1 cupin domain-containing protein [Roseibacterium sp. SDUM158017]